MRLSAVVAMDENRLIGDKQRLPWHLPADLRHFKAITEGKAVLMGRKTFASIGRALSDRINIVITRDHSFYAPEVVVAYSVEEALSLVAPFKEVFVIGGGELFQAFLPKIQRIYLTVVHHSFVGDTYFPKLAEGEWEEMACEPCKAESDNPYDYSFITLERISRNNPVKAQSEEGAEGI